MIDFPLIGTRFHGFSIFHDRKIDPDEKIVCYVTGNGLKAPDASFVKQPELKIVEPKREVLQNIIRR